MRFLIGKSVYEVAIEGQDCELERTGWLDGKRLVILRELRPELAWNRLIDLCCEAWLNERGGFSAETSAKLELADRIGPERAADVIGTFERQFEFAGGLATLAEMMGLVVEPAGKPVIDWPNLTPEQRRENVIRWCLCGHLSDALFAEYQERYTALGLNPIAEDCFPEVILDQKEHVRRVKLIVTLKSKQRIAARVGGFGGFVEQTYVDRDGTITDMWTKPYPPRSAIATLLRTDTGERITASADWDAYAVYLKDGQTLSKWWERMGTFMLMKCAKSLALSDAYAECAGLPIREEMRPDGRGRKKLQQGGSLEALGQALGRPEGTVCTLDGDDDAIDAGDIAPQGFTARLHGAMIQAGCPRDGVAAIVDQIRAKSGTLEDDNPELFIEACVNEVRKRFRRRR